MARAGAAAVVLATSLGLIGVQASASPPARRALVASVLAVVPAPIVGADVPASAEPAVPEGPADAPGADVRAAAIGRAVASRRAAPVRSLAWPYHGPITGPFGERRGNHIHPGIDISGHPGAMVRAAARGVVVVAGWAPSGYSGYGMMVAIDHGNGLLTMYAHLSLVSVAVGQTVDTGDLVGAVGCTGTCTGPHLHFEVRLGGRPVNPMGYLTPGS